MSSPASAPQIAPENLNTSSFTSETSMHTESEDTTLKMVNVPLSQTWNYLRINTIPFRVKKPQKSGTLYARLPSLFSRVEVGLGKEAVAWIEAVAPDAHVIEVPKGEARKEPIVLSVFADDLEAKDTGIIVREGAEATIVCVSYSHNNESTTSANLCRIIAERDTRVHLIEVVALGDMHEHLQGIGISADARAEIDVRQYALGGQKVAFGFYADLFGERSRLDLMLRYFVRGRERLDVNHIARQRGRNTRVNMLSNGILDDFAHKTLRETIDLVHGAKGSKGNEAETVLVASDNVVNETLPVILCDEDDVLGNHGASIGSLGPEQLRYLADRGIDEEEANMLCIRAIFDDAAIHAPDALSRKAIFARAHEAIGQDLAQDFMDAMGETTPAL